MKKMVLMMLWTAAVLIVLAISVLASGQTEKISARDKQEKLHEIAEIAREIGLPEDDVIITRAQELWWEADEEAKMEKTETLTYIGEYRITGYDPFCSHCCGKSDGITASGKKAVIGQTVAMQDFPFGTRIFIDGLGYFIVQDRGGFPKTTIDVACASHDDCYAITGKYDVYIVEG